MASSLCGCRLDMQHRVAGLGQRIHGKFEVLRPVVVVLGDLVVDFASVIALAVNKSERVSGPVLISRHAAAGGDDRAGTNRCTLQKRGRMKMSPDEMKWMNLSAPVSRHLIFSIVFSLPFACPMCSSRLKYAHLLCLV
jgi:hypothetical protein